MFKLGTYQGNNAIKKNHYAKNGRQILQDEHYSRSYLNKKKQSLFMAVQFNILNLCDLFIS